MRNYLRVDKFISVLRKSREIRALQILALLSLPLFGFFCLFVMEYMNFGGQLQGVMAFLQHSPLSALFSAVAILISLGVLLLICRKAVIVGGILGAGSLLSAYINYMKVATNGDNFFPRDIAMIGRTGELAYFIGGTAVPRWFWVGLVVVVLWVVALWFFRAELPLGWKIRLPSATCAILALVLLFSTPQRSEAVLGRFDMSFFDAAL